MMSEHSIDATLNQLNNWFVQELMREAFELANADGLYSLGWDEMKEYVAQTPDGHNALSAEKIVSCAKEIGVVVAHGDEGMYVLAASN